MIMSRATSLGMVGEGATETHLLSVPTTTGQRCLLIERGKATASSCLNGSSLFTQRPVAYLVQSTGGRKATSIQSESVVGVASRDVDALEVKLLSGKTHRLTVTSRHTFEYSEPVATIHARDLLARLVVLHRGAVVGSFPLTR